MKNEEMKSTQAAAEAGSTGAKALKREAKVKTVAAEVVTPTHERRQRVQAAETCLAVLKALAVPQPVIDAIEVCWQGYLAMPPTTLGDTLLLADELAPVESPLRDLDGCPRAGMAASIDLLVGEETLRDILRESAADVASLTAALRS